MKLFRHFFVCSIIVAPLFICNSSIAQSSEKQTYKIAAETPELTEAAPFDVQITENNTQKFVLVINNPKQEKLKISFRTPEGVRDYNETTLSVYRKRYDLTGSADGNYTVRVTNGKKRISKKIRFNTSGDVVKTINIQ